MDGLTTDVALARGSVSSRTSTEDLAPTSGGTLRRKTATSIATSTVSRTSSATSPPRTANGSPTAESIDRTPSPSGKSELRKGHSDELASPLASPDDTDTEA